MDFVAQAGVAAWERCDDSAARGPRPRWTRAPRELYTNGGRLLRAHFEGEALVAKRLPDPTAGRQLCALMKRLADRCAHVPAPHLLEGSEESLWLCMPYLEGGVWFERDGAIERDGAKPTLAQALASLHAAMRALPTEAIVPASRARAGRVLAWLERESASAEVRRLAAVGGRDPAGLRAALAAWLALPAQPVHHDLHVGNVWESRGAVWFLDFDEMPTAFLPASADVMRYAERHLLVPDQPLARFEAFWRDYHRSAGSAKPDAGHAFAALAWNWIDSWATLQGLDPRPVEYAAERAKFLAILDHHAERWPDLARRIDAWAAG